MNRYEEIAEAAGVRLCDLPDCTWKGGTDKGVVHMSRVRYTRAGALYLLLMAYSALHQPSAEPSWLRRWRRAMWVNEMAAKAKVRIPSAMWEEERAKVREGLSRTETRLFPGTRAQAARWAGPRPARWT